MSVGKNLRWGYTTGTCAAAAAKAAAVALINKKKVKEVSVKLPSGRDAVLPVSKVELFDNRARAAVIKDAGDDPDITDGAEIWGEIKIEGTGIRIRGGKGVGRVTKPGLAAKVGAPAINPVPLKMIRDEVADVLPQGTGAEVIISVPEGEKLAVRTLNPKLGIVGGISILGTSGIVRPMSQDAYIRSLIPQLDQAMALGLSYLLFTPGGMGNRIAAEMGANPDSIVQTSNFVGRMLQEARKRDIKGVILFGHIGKLVKVAAGIFNTHSRVADARRETMAAYAALEGAPPEVIKRILEANTAEEGAGILKENGLENVFYRLAEAISRRAGELCEGEIRIGSVIYSLKGNVLGYDEDSLAMGEVVGWKPK